VAHLEYAGTGSAAETESDALAAFHRPTAQNRLYRVLPMLIVLTALLLWEWSARAGLTSALFFPAPSTIAITLEGLLMRGSLLQDIGVTVYRVAIGLLIGGTAGIVLGMLMGWSARVRMVAEPFVAGLHPIPKSALLPLLLILMGIGDRPRLALIALAAFFPLVVNTMNSVRSIEPAHLEAAANYGARGFRLFRRVVVPASLPGMLTGGRIAVNTAMTIAITTELLTSRDGLGARIWMAAETMRTENLYAVLFVIAVIGLAINWLLLSLTRRLMPWDVTLPVTEQ